MYLPISVAIIGYIYFSSNNIIYTDRKGEMKVEKYA